MGDIKHPSYWSEQWKKEGWKEREITTKNAPYTSHTTSVTVPKLLPIVHKCGKSQVMHQPDNTAHRNWQIK